MEAPLILADRLMQVIRDSGLNKEQAEAALRITSHLLDAAVEDFPGQFLRELPAAQQ